jgi:hypothetical protein
MDPGEAADRLADLDAPAGRGDEEVVEERRITIEERPQGTKTVRLVRVDANFRPVEIIGDPAVREAVAEGSHRIRYEGDTLVVDGATGFDDDDEDFGDDDEHRQPFGEWFRVGGPMIRRGVHINYGSGREFKPKPLRVRMNPDAGLEARVEAGPLKILRVHGPIKARVTAGPLRIEDFESPLDVRVAAGKVEATGRLDHGVSTIDCDAGKVTLHLTHGSHARVNASATLGKVDFGGGRERGRRRDYFDEIKVHGLGDLGGLGGLSDLGGIGERVASMLNNAFSDEHEVVVGDGTATIDIRVSMGAADITFDDQPSS